MSMKKSAANLGLVEMVQLSEEVVEISKGDAEVDEDEKEIEDGTVEDKMEEKISCMPGCCTSLFISLSISIVQGLADLKTMTMVTKIY